MLKGQYEAAAHRFRRLAGEFEAAGDTQQAAEAIFWYGYCRAKQGKANSAARAYGEVIRRYASTPAARQARRQLDLLAETRTEAAAP